MELNQVFVTQNSVRHVERIPQMVKYVKCKGVFSREALEEFAKQEGKKPSPLIQIYRLLDTSTGKKTNYIHDGHHRVSAIYMARRHYLHREEYELHQWTYEDYCSINFDYSYVTPYDPRTHVRLGDTCPFKREARKLAEQDPEAAKAFIYSYPEQYCTERIIWTVRELADVVRGDLKQIRDNNSVDIPLPSGSLLLDRV